MDNVVDIKLFVNEFFNLDISSKSRIRKNVYARAIYYKLCIGVLGKVTYTCIGLNVNRDHATVIYFLREFESLIKYDELFKEMYYSIYKKIDKMFPSGNFYRKQYSELEELVIEWAKDKGILEKGNTLAQCNKTLEEVHELEVAIIDKNKDEIIDALGDILVTIIIQAEMNGLSLIDCLNSAYNVIKKRTGKMVGGQFVKDK